VAETGKQRETATHPKQRAGKGGAPRGLCDTPAKSSTRKILLKKLPINRYDKKFMN